MKVTEECNFKVNTKSHHKSVCWYPIDSVGKGSFCKKMIYISQAMLEQLKKKYIYKIKQTNIQTKQQQQKRNWEENTPN